MIHEACVASSAREVELREVPAYWVAKYLGRGFYKLTAAVSAAVVSAKVLFLAERERDWEVEEGLFRLMHGGNQLVRPIRLPAPLPDGVEIEARVQAVLLRDVLGNPLRPVAFDPSRRTQTALILGKQMHDSRDYSAMPILADALQDAGCEDENLLHHCRGPGPHARGCWVVDSLLGKA